MDIKIYKMTEYLQELSNNGINISVNMDLVNNLKKYIDEVWNSRIDPVELYKKVKSGLRDCDEDLELFNKSVKLSTDKKYKCFYRYEEREFVDIWAHPWGKKTKHIRLSESEFRKLCTDDRLRPKNAEFANIKPGDWFEWDYNKGLYSNDYEWFISATIRCTIGAADYWWDKRLRSKPEVLDGDKYVYRFLAENPDWPQFHQQGYCGWYIS